MESILFRYRSRQLDANDIAFVKETIARHYNMGRSYISRILCEAWAWKQPNGKLKECATRDILLRLEERGFVTLPPRIKPQKNNRTKTFEQIPLFFVNQELSGSIKDYKEPKVRLVIPTIGKGCYLWDYLLYHYHYLGLPRLVGEHIRHEILIGDQVVACLGWASAAWKIKDRDLFIGWNEHTKRKNLHLVANNVRFLIPPWIRIKHLASRALSMSLRRLSSDWQGTYGHPVYLAETFVDNARFEGTCYKAANWKYVGHTRGSAKKGNSYHYHGQSKAIYLYPLHRHFRRFFKDDQG